MEDICVVQVHLTPLTSSSLCQRIWSLVFLLVHLPTMPLDADSNPSQSGASCTSYFGAMTRIVVRLRGMSKQRTDTKSCTVKPHFPDIKRCTSS